MMASGERDEMAASILAALPPRPALATRLVAATTANATALRLFFMFSMLVTP